MRKISHRKPPCPNSMRNEMESGDEDGKASPAPPHSALWTSNFSKWGRAQLLCCFLQKKNKNK